MRRAVRRRQHGGLLETIADLGITAISCTPSYPALLEQMLRSADRQPRNLGLRLGLCGGEAGLDNPEFRQHLEDIWGMRAQRQLRHVGGAQQLREPPQFWF